MCLQILVDITRFYNFRRIKSTTDKGERNSGGNDISFSLHPDLINGAKSPPGRAAASLSTNRHACLFSRFDQRKLNNSESDKICKCSIPNV